MGNTGKRYSEAQIIAILKEAEADDSPIDPDTPVRIRVPPPFLTLSAAFAPHCGPY